MDTDAVILSFILFLLFSPVFWIITLGPTLFTIALTKACNGAHILKRKNKADDLPEIVKLLSRIESGDAEYSIMEFSIHFYTLLASIFAVNIAYWQMVYYATLFASSGQAEDWSLLRPYTLAIKGIFLTLVSFFVMVSGVLGSPTVVESFTKPRARIVGSLTWPPLNRILVLRIVSAAIGLYIAYLTFFGLNIRILP